MSDALLAGLISVAGSLVSAGAIWGALGQRTKDHDRRLNVVESENKNQWETLTHHGERLTKVETKLETHPHECAARAGRG